MKARFIGRSLAFLFAGLVSSCKTTTLFSQDRHQQTQQELQTRLEIQKQQEFIRRQNQINQLRGLTLFTFGDVQIWALNQRNADRKFHKYQQQLCS